MPEAANPVVDLRLMGQPRLALNVTKTRCVRVPGETVEFLKNRAGRNYDRCMCEAYLGTRLCGLGMPGVYRKISALTEPRYELPPAPEVVKRLNRGTLGWAKEFHPRHASLIYADRRQQLLHPPPRSAPLPRLYNLLRPHSIYDDPLRDRLELEVI